MQRMRVTLFLTLLATVLPLGSAKGQEPARRAPLQEIVAELDSATVVRISEGSRQVDGVFQALRRNTLVVSTMSGPTDFSVPQVDSLWTQTSGKRTGALIGMGLGLGLTTLTCAQTFRECGLEVGLLVITPTLALMGAGFGSLVPGWLLRYP